MHYDAKIICDIECETACVLLINACTWTRYKLGGLLVGLNLYCTTTRVFEAETHCTLNCKRCVGTYAPAMKELCVVCTQDFCNILYYTPHNNVPSESIVTWHSPVDCVLRICWQADPIVRLSMAEVLTRLNELQEMEVMQVAMRDESSQPSRSSCVICWDFFVQGADSEVQAVNWPSSVALQPITRAV